MDININLTSDAALLVEIKMLYKSKDTKKPCSYQNLIGYLNLLAACEITEINHTVCNALLKFFIFFSPKLE